MSKATDGRWPHILSPFALGALELPNRTVVAPMTRISADPEGVPTAQMAAHYSEFARGGFGLIITEGTFVGHKAANGYERVPAIYGDVAMATRLRNFRDLCSKGRSRLSREPLIVTLPNFISLWRSSERDKKQQNQRGHQSTALNLVAL